MLSDQLTSEVRDNSHSTGYSLAYTYDHNANRLTKVVGTGGGAVTTTNTYGTHDQLLTSGSKSYGYDSNGNCTSVSVGTSVTSISYDYENRVVGITYPSSRDQQFRLQWRRHADAEGRQRRNRELPLRRHDTGECGAQGRQCGLHARPFASDAARRASSTTATRSAAPEA